jgi:hypothetical protein
MKKIPLPFGYYTHFARLQRCAAARVAMRLINWTNL